MPEPLRTSWRHIKRWCFHYFYGLFATSFNGSISAVDSFIGLAVGAAVSVDIQAINWKGALAVFLTTYARQVVQYFKANPIPEKLRDEEASAPPFPPAAPVPEAERFDKLPA